MTTKCLTCNLPVLKVDGILSHVDDTTYTRAHDPRVAAETSPFCETCGGLVDEPRESGNGCHCGMTNDERQRLGLAVIPSTVDDGDFVQHAK